MLLGLMRWKRIVGLIGGKPEIVVIHTSRNG